MNRQSKLRMCAVSGGVMLALVLSGCQMQLGGTGEDGPRPASSARIVERDVEAPEVFSVTEKGLWDGRPSLGGVWVAHPDVKDPERVIIRNSENGKFVIGALFRRERANPGPKLQLSSDAAEALGALAGQPVALNVVALRREEAEAPAAETAAAAPAPETAAIAAETVAATPLPPASGKPAKPAASPAPAAAPAATETRPARPAPALGKAYVQIGIFSVQANATRAADQLRKAGVVPTIRKGESQGKDFWRVIAGPAASKSDRAALLAKIKSLGYGDAYAVSN